MNYMHIIQNRGVIYGREHLLPSFRPNPLGR